MYEYIMVGILIGFVVGMLVTMILSMKYPRILHEVVWIEFPPEYEVNLISIYKNIPNHKFCIVPPFIELNGKKFDMKGGKLVMKVTLPTWFDYSKNHPQLYLADLLKIAETNDIIPLGSGVC